MLIPSEVFVFEVNPTILKDVFCKAVVTNSQPHKRWENVPERKNTVVSVQNLGPYINNIT